MTPATIAALLAEKQQLVITDEVAASLATYLDLLLKWNARTNLSAIRDPEAIVLRHFGESLQCAKALPPAVQTLLDYGSGGGFPGMPCALARSSLRVTLAESQNKKAAFLQELARTLPVQAAVFAGRVELMAPSCSFDGVVLRAVDRIETAAVTARLRVKLGGWLILMTTYAALEELAPRTRGLAWVPPVPLRGSERGVIAMARCLTR